MSERRTLCANFPPRCILAHPKEKSKETDRQIAIMSKTDNNRALSPPHISLASLADIIAAVRTYRIGTIPGGCRKKHPKPFL